MTGQRFQRERHILREFCQAEGLHHSEKREAVLESFLAAEHHITAEDLLRHMEARHISIDLKTVQSALDLMVKAGLARDVRLEDGTLIFEHIFAHRHHDHMICRTCGRMIEFLSPTIERLQDEVAATHNFVVEDHCLAIYGVCASCADKAHLPDTPALSRRERAQLVPLVQLKPGQHGIVREIAGGEGVAKRLAALGMRPGKRLIKVSAMLMGGPVVISIDGRQLALGHCMAAKVLVDME